MYFYCRGYNTHALWVSMTCYKRTGYTTMLLLDFMLDMAVGLYYITVGRSCGSFSCHDFGAAKRTARRMARVKPL